MKVFMSYFSDEESEAQDLSDHLKKVFKKDDLEVFIYSSWESIAPGDQWEDKVLEGLMSASALLVLMSHDALTRPWINFEIGVAWAKKIRILLLCHKGMTPSALPSPYNSLQAIDLNELTHEEKLNRLAEAFAKALNLTITTDAASTIIAEPTESGATFNTTLRGWTLRPAGHMGETAKGRFLVGVVLPSRDDRAEAAGFEPGEALFVRLFLSTRPEGRFINAMVGGEVAAFFEKTRRDTVAIDAVVRVAGARRDENSGESMPILVIDEAKQVASTP